MDIYTVLRVGSLAMALNVAAYGCSAPVVSEAPESPRAVESIPVPTVRAPVSNVRVGSADALEPSTGQSCKTSSDCSSRCCAFQAGDAFTCQLSAAACLCMDDSECADGNRCVAVEASGGLSVCSPEGR